MKALIAVMVLAAPTVALAEPLDLECRGDAVVTKHSTTDDYKRQANGRYAFETENHINTLNVTGVVRVHIDGDGKGRIRIPGPLQTSGRGDDGWWDFTSLEVTDDAIRGRFSMGILTKPRVTIDRRTGDIDYNGGETRFAGTCERAAAATERKF